MCTNEDFSLNEIAQTLRQIPDNGTACDREILPDGTEVILSAE